MSDLKNKLFNTGYFKNNNWFNKYIQLIEDNKNTKQQSGITQQHHILPRAYFKIINKPCEHQNNIVNLKYSNHILAHYYLCYCTKKEFKYSCYKAFQCLTNMAPEDFNLQAFYNQNSIDYDLWYKEYIENISGINHWNYGKHLTLETKEKIRQSSLGKVLSKQAKEKVSESLKNNNRAGKPVRCIETNVIYKNACEANRITGINRQCINRCCRGEYSHAGNMHWEYVN